jgi:hypothetical protein
MSAPQCKVMKNYIIVFLAQVVFWQSWMKSPEARPAWPGGRPESHETVPGKRKGRSTCHRGWPDGRDEGRCLGKIFFLHFREMKVLHHLDFSRAKLKYLRKDFHSLS